MGSRTRSLRPLVAARGYIHLAEVREAGWRPDAIRAAVEREGLVRAGRDWVLLPTAPPEVLLAARTGCAVTCVSAASLRTLWRADDDRTVHLAVPRGARSSPPTAHAHWGAGVVPRPRLLLIDAVENMLAAVAACRPHEQALAIWESAVHSRLITVEGIGAIDWRGGRARALRDETTALSHSGLETFFVSRMRRRGIDVRQQVKIDGHHVDGLIGSRLILQIDGFAHHSDPRQRRSDIAHDRRLRLLGYTVLRFDYREIVDDWPRVEATVMAAVAQNLHLAR